MFYLSIGVLCKKNVLEGRKGKGRKNNLLKMGKEIQKWRERKGGNQHVIGKNQ